MRQRYESRGNHQYRCAVVLGSDFGNHLHPPQLQRGGIHRNLCRGGGQFYRSEGEHHAALVFLRDAQAGQCKDDQTDDQKIEDRKHPGSLAYYSMLSPCSEISRPWRSCSSVTRNPMVLSITFKITKLAVN